MTKLPNSCIELSLCQADKHSVRCPQFIAVVSIEQIVDGVVEEVLTTRSEPTYYLPHANPKFCTPICSLCGAVIGFYKEHRDQHTAWHASLATSNARRCPFGEGTEWPEPNCLNHPRRETTSEQYVTGLVSKSNNPRPSHCPGFPDCQRDYSHQHWSDGKVS